MDRLQWPRVHRERRFETLDAALREFREETGFEPHGPFIELGETRQPGGKIVTAWAFEGDCDPALLRSNTCMVEWPPHSGKQMEIPEVDRGGWFTLDQARTRIFKGQDKFLDRLAKSFENGIDGERLTRREK